MSGTEAANDPTWKKTVCYPKVEPRLSNRMVLSQEPRASFAHKQSHLFGSNSSY